MMNFRTTPYHSVVMNEIYVYALKLLRGRDYTVSELRAKLKAKFGAVPPELMERLLQRKFVKPDWPSLKEALAAKMIIDLQRCQRVTDYVLKYTSTPARTAEPKKTQ